MVIEFLLDKTRIGCQNSRVRGRCFWNAIFGGVTKVSVIALALVGLCGGFSADEPRALGDLAARYGVSIEFEKPAFPVETAHGEIAGAAAAEDELAKYAPILIREWSLYPVSLVRKTKLKRIVLCRDLAFAGQKRTAVPDFENETLYLDVSRGLHAERYVRKVIHHEFFHMIDWRDDGAVYSDRSWMGLNPKGFTYGDGGVNAQDDPTVSLHTEAAPGFLNRYSMSGVEEDKAELFAHLLVEPAFVARRSKQDAFLGAKTARLKELLRDFCPDLDDEFWRRSQGAAERQNRTKRR